MRIFILGNKGMLGRYVFDYFKLQSFDVVGLSREDLDAGTVSETDLFELGFGENDIVINCIGIIKRNDVSKLDYVIVNSRFPHLLSNVCNKIGSKLIHITTDCVYDGVESNYNEEHDHTATDVYGMSKSLGEPENATIIRTSIIGEEKGQSRSLVEWIKSNRDNTVNGYTNHFWNGITCLQFAKVCEYVINNNFFWEGIKHIISPTVVSKLELVNMVSDIYDLNMNVVPFEAPSKCDRSMSSIRNDIEIGIPELEIQIKEMKDFY